jgi:hypothetical protein
MATRKRRAVITEEETTVTRRRQIDLTDTETDAPAVEPLRFAPGWAAVPQLTGPEARAQREEQVQQALRFIAAAAFADPVHDRHAIENAACILRAGPGASPMERLYGRV